MKCDEQGPGLVKFNISPWVLAGVEYKCGAREKDTDWSAVLPLKKLPTPRLWPFRCNIAVFHFIC
jgi:hypothetical protein